ncbi:uncharacterized protein LOC127877570 [Dreissena polymorpha]|uniref:Protein aurora borealis n=1 Tax=Dreissena polymorpha TaxID=45954 RepID=A0A9D4K2Q3_DREPO|nr:uncharacterized protein LOC127877570 [Dreissena polymorpha]KAH3830388.1 hypothetical protein DPMN_103631 [Dreissena polymorpha]
MEVHGQVRDVTSPPRNPSHHPLPQPLCSPIVSDGCAMSHGSPKSCMACPTPSPAGKRFIGLPNNARNDIYMKTLMNSPYHKSYTPMSATPGYSPMYTTPVRVPHTGKSEPHGTGPDPSPHPGGSISTPQGTRPPGTRPPGSGHKYATPKNVILNPFEAGLDDLHLPAYMSPGFFTVTSTPASEERRQFRWSIEHLAELNPADIDPMPMHQAPAVLPDRETEERAQRAIEQFFANNLIVPSPWSDPQKPRKKNILPSTPGPQGSHHSEALMQELQGSIQKALPASQGKVDASCQTMLSLPVNFDLNAVLGAYVTGDTDEGTQEMLSTSSLRRKLFFHGDTSSLAPSPVKNVGHEVEPESPCGRQQRHSNWERITPLKNTPAFSSSPIKSACTPQHRRCSSDPEFLASPELSPIVQGSIPKTGARSRSSGMFEMHPDEFDISPVTAGDSGRHHSLVSPIPFQGLMEENTEDDFRPKFEDSPGFSPIRPPKTPTRKILRKSQEESYIQEEVCDSDGEESVTPVSSRPHVPSPSAISGESMSPICHNLPQKNASTLPKSHSCTDLHTTMDFESGGNPRENILTSSLCDTRDFTSSDHFHDDTQQHHSLSNQDTGYQTASLQSTNQESLHTNLTNQFSSLPFNLTNPETAFPNTSQSSDKAPVMNLAHHISLIADRDDSDEDEHDFNINNVMSSPIFPTKQKLFFDDDLDLQDTPKNSVSTRLSFDDSALPEEYDFGHRHMEVDIKTSNMECVVNSQEEVVLSRARETLAIANSLYPKDRATRVTGSRLRDIDSRSFKSGITLKQKIGGDKPMSASELAYSIIQRAGADLAKYKSLMRDKTTHELTIKGLHSDS